MHPKDEKEKQRMSNLAGTAAVQHQVEKVGALIITEEAGAMMREAAMRSKPISDLDWQKALSARVVHRLGTMFVLAATDVDAKTAEIDALKDRVAELQKPLLPSGVMAPVDPAFKARFERSTGERWIRECDAVPFHLLAGLLTYVETGRLPGEFLRSVLSNSLSEAVSLADPDSLAALPALVRVVYNCLPSMCWGSPERMMAWASKARQSSNG